MNPGSKLQDKSVVLVSQTWPNEKGGGVGMVAGERARMLLDVGCVVHLLGGEESVFALSAETRSRAQIPARGRTALFSRPHADRNLLKATLLELAPDLVIVEGWQFALNEAAIDECIEQHIPFVLISHGAGKHPYTLSIFGLLDSMRVLPYYMFRFRRILSKVSALGVLDTRSKSKRFYDRDVAIELRKKIFHIPNVPRVALQKSVPHSERERVVLVAGYFSRIKNQLRAIRVAHKLRNSGIRFILYGNQTGLYFRMCNYLVKILKLNSMVEFIDSSHNDLEKRIANSLCVLSTSITEAQPNLLLEAMALGTPFVSTRVGCVEALNGGIAVDGDVNLAQSVEKYCFDKEKWEAASEAGQRQIYQEFNVQYVQANLRAAMEFALYG